MLPILSPLPIVQTFWLGAMTLLLAGRWPSGLPPAWVTGEAQPWPSPAGGPRRARRRGPTPEPEPDGEPVERSGNGGPRPCFAQEEA